MDGGPSKFKPAQDNDNKLGDQQRQAPTQQNQETGTAATGGTSAEQHEENKIVLIVSALAIAALSFFDLRR